MEINKYQNGKIYKITGNGLTYYGSTCDSLENRLRQHKYSLVGYNKRQKGYCTSYEVITDENCIIELVEEFPCETKKDLGKREKHYIKNNECVNKALPTRSDAEYYQDNKEKLNENMRKYYEQNKKKIREHNDKYRDEHVERHKEYQTEYRQSEKYKNYKKEYYEKKKDQWNAKQKEKINCPTCNNLVCRGALKRHQNSSKCILII
jgi:hypothetical protein